jgi:hypothetical protein
MGKIVGAERRGYSIRLINQNNGYLELFYKAPSQPEQSVGVFEEAFMAKALEEFHAIARVVVA